MRLLAGLTAGLAGAVVLTVTHQLLHKYLNDAPRMDLMGEEAIQKMGVKTGDDISEEDLYKLTMAGDIASNSLYYSIAAKGDPKNAVIRGGLLGLAAGMGGVYMPKHLGLNNQYSNRTLKTYLMTVGIYLLGGLVSGKVAALLGREGEKVRRDK